MLILYVMMIPDTLQWFSGRSGWVNNSSLSAIYIYIYIKVPMRSIGAIRYIRAMFQFLLFRVICRMSEAKTASWQLQIVAFLMVCFCACCTYMKQAIQPVSSSAISVPSSTLHQHFSYFQAAKRTPKQQFSSS